MSKIAFPSFLKDLVCEIRFAEPVPHFVPSMFKQIRLPQELLDLGESEVFLGEKFQKHRIEALCSTCCFPMRKVGEIEWSCLNNRCRLFAQVVTVTPLRGVVGVVTFPESVRYTERGIDFIDWVLIVLDRRYGESVHKAVRSLAGMVCDQAGVRIL